MNNNLEDIIKLFAKYSPAKVGYMVMCPFHKDDTPSLHLRIDEQTNKLLVKCFAGCDRNDILKYISNNGSADGILPKEVLERIAQGKPAEAVRIDYKLEKAYTYRNTNGEGLYQILRHSYIDEEGKKKKDFKFRRPATPQEREDFGLKWVWKSDPDILILYNLNLINDLRYSNPTEWIYKCEGEKDCDTLVDKGLVATCNPFGAGQEKWLPAYNKMLEGLNVVLIPDHDPAGYKHVYHVVSEILPLVKGCKIVPLSGTLSYHDDVTDWINKGHTVDELKTLVEKAPDLVGKSLDEIKELFPMPNFDTVEDNTYPAEGLTDTKEEIEITLEKTDEYEEFMRRLLVSEVKQEGCGICRDTGWEFDGDKVKCNVDAEGQPVLIPCTHGTENTVDYGL